MTTSPTQHYFTVFTSDELTADTQYVITGFTAVRRNSEFFDTVELTAAATTDNDTDDSDTVTVTQHEFTRGLTNNAYTVHDITP